MILKNSIYSFSPRVLTRIIALFLSVIITFFAVKIASTIPSKDVEGESDKGASESVDASNGRAEEGQREYALLLDGAVEVGTVIKGQGGVICELSEGRVLADKNGFGKIALKNATSFLAALAVTKAVSEGRVLLTDNAVCPASAARGEDYGLSSDVLPIGKRMAVGDILKCMLYLEGSSYAYTLAVHIFGSEEGLVNEMNAIASQLGLRETLISGCNAGVFCAYDFAVIVKKAMADPIIRQIFCSDERITVGYGSSESITLVVSNMFFKEYCTAAQAAVDGISGGKISIYQGSGWGCVLFNNSGKEYVSISLGTQQAFSDAMMLYSAFVLAAQ